MFLDQDPLDTNQIRGNQSKDDMELKARRETRLCPPEPNPYPWLLFRNGRSYRNQFFCNITKPGKKQLMKNIAVLRRKTILPCSHGWLFLLEIDQCFLWNPVTLESIQLPSLALGPKREIGSSILSSSPGNPDCSIIIFVKSVPLLMFCRVGDQQWTEQSVREYCDNNVDRFEDSICCNGKLYARTFAWNKLVVIKQDLPDSFVIHSHGTIPHFQDHSNHSRSYMVESCGEVFVIYLVRGGKLFADVTGVEVFKLDFSLMEWIKVEYAKDRAFFVDEKAAYSCPALKPETEGNRIFFTLSDDKSLYSIDIEENSVSVSLPGTDLKPPWSSPIWVMPDLSLSPVHRRMEKIEPDQIEDIVPCVESKNKEEIGYFCELPLDLLSSVASCLVLHDYMNFRVVNRICRLAAPPIHWPATIKKLVRHSLAPWLMVCKKGQDKCKFIDPLHRERYLMNNPNKSSEVRMCYSKEGWCLMLQGEYTIFFWNPFTKKIILLPKLPHEFKTIIGCDFSSSPDSSGCLLVLIYEDYPYIDLDYILVGEGHWESLYAFKWKDFKLSKNNNPVFYNEELYLLGSEGNLGVFREGFIWEVLDKPQRPCKSFYQSFLLQGNGKLLSVFVGFMGKWLKVFELNLSTMNWVEIDNVRDKVIHVSRISSFSTAATTEEMRNTVCLPRFYEDNLVYYSLDSKKYHCYGSNVVMEDFYNTKEQLYSGWIEPRW